MSSFHVMWLAAKLEGRTSQCLDRMALSSPAAYRPLRGRRTPVANGSLWEPILRARMAHRASVEQAGKWKRSRRAGPKRDLVASLPVSGLHVGQFFNRPRQDKVGSAGWDASGNDKAGKAPDRPTGGDDPW